MLNDLLTQNQTAILDKWRALIAATYKTDVANFLMQQKDQFHNPVGHAIFKETENLYNQLLQNDRAPNDTAINNLIKIRAIQDLTPSQAVHFIFLLKQAIREELLSQVCEHKLVEDLLGCESNIDSMALKVFDAYMECREKVCEIRVKEVKNRLGAWMREREMREKSEPKEDSNSIP